MNDRQAASFSRTSMFVRAVNVKIIVPAWKKKCYILSEIATIKLLSVSCTEGNAFCTSTGSIYSWVQNTACIPVLYVQYMLLHNGHNLYSILWQFQFHKIVHFEKTFIDAVYMSNKIFSRTFLMIIYDLYDRYMTLYIHVFERQSV